MLFFFSFLHINLEIVSPVCAQAKRIISTKLFLSIPPSEQGLIIQGYLKKIIMLAQSNIVYDDWWLMEELMLSFISPDLILLWRNWDIMPGLLSYAFSLRKWNLWGNWFGWVASLPYLEWLSQSSAYFCKHFRSSQSTWMNTQPHTSQTTSWNGLWSWVKSNLS